MSESNEGRVAVITGGSRGIGRGIAERFAGLGCKVALTARTQDAADAVASEINEQGGAAVTSETGKGGEFTGS